MHDQQMTRKVLLKKITLKVAQPPSGHLWARFLSMSILEPYLVKHIQKTPTLRKDLLRYVQQ